AVAGMRLAALWDVPHITMFHTIERLKTRQYGGGATDLTPAALIRIEQEGRIAASVDRITVSTEHERDALRQHYRLAASKVRLIPCGVNLATFTPGTAAQRREARQALAPGKTPLLLCVGRLDPIKGLDLLLESVAQLRHEARLTVIGGEPSGDQDVERL